MTESELLEKINEAKRSNALGLDLFFEELMSLPGKIGELVDLQELHLYGNSLTSLPREIGQLAKLEMLNLDGNSLTSLPREIGRLRQLRKLFLSNNGLMNLPEEIGLLTHLNRLDIDSNGLTRLPESLLVLAEQGILKQLYLHGNDALGIPPEILGPTWNEVQNKKAKSADPREILQYYFEKRRAGNTRPLNEAKVLFIGEAEVGKSSLITALKEGPTKRDFDKTRGIVREVWRPEGNQYGSLRLNLWDFGGQEVYHATHTFFLTERAVYVVVVSARDSDAQNNIEYWLQMARSFGRDASIIVAVNKADQHSDGPDIHQLQRKYGPGLRFIRVSCWTGEGMSELEAAICGYVNADSEVRREMPASWLRIKDALEAMTQETLPLIEYRKLCVENGETSEKNQDLLLELWHRLGAVLYFHHDPDDPDEFQEMGILNPEWVTKGVYAVLDNQSLRERNGILTRNQLKQALRDANYTGSHPHFIEAMMRKFELIYDAPERTPDTMLVARLLDEKEPEFAWPKKDVLRFEYRYGVLPPGLVPRFIVRRHELLSTAPKPWRNGCVLEVRDCRVLVRCNRENKKVEIQVDGPPTLRRDALDYIRYTFEDIHSLTRGLPVEPYLEVPGRPDAPMLKYNHLRNLEANGITVDHADGSVLGEIISVNVSEALGSVRTLERERREYQESVSRKGYGADSTMTRNELLTFLERLPDADLTRVILRINGGNDTPHLAKPERVSALVSFAESSIGPGLAEIETVIAELFGERSGAAPGSGARYSPPTNVYHIGRVDRFTGAGSMNDNNSTITFGSGNVAGNVSSIAGNNNTVTQTATVDQKAQALANDPKELQAKFDELRALIEQARKAGADTDDCNFAVKKVDQLATAAANPSDAAAKNATPGAVGILKGISDGFKSFGEIGDSFEKIMKLVVPALTLLLNVPIPPVFG